jgi:hypothetical protein
VLSSCGESLAGLNPAGGMRRLGPPLLCSRVIISQALKQLEGLAPRGALLDLGIEGNEISGARKPQSGQKLSRLESYAWRKTSGEILDRSAKRIRDPLQAGGVRSVHALFILLDLLEADPDRKRELRLRDAANFPQGFDPRSNHAVGCFSPSSPLDVFRGHLGQCRVASPSSSGNSAASRP